MFNIRNKSQDKIKSYVLTLANKDVTIIKTEKDFPISDSIEIYITDKEIGKDKRVRVELSVTYANGKKQHISSSSFNVALLNLIITTYGATRPMGISVSSQIVDNDNNLLDKDYILIKKAVAEYIDANNFNVSKEDILKLIPSDLTPKLERIEDALGGVVTPQMFGAKGDGVTDDTVAVQKALDVGGRIFFPEGTYIISNSIYETVCLNTKKVGTTLEGVAGKSIIKASDIIQKSCDFLRVSHDNFTVRNLVFRGSETFGNYSSGIALLPFWHVNNVVVKDCLFQNNGYAAIIMRGGKNYVIDGVTVEACDCSIVQQSYPVSDVKITNCHITGLSSLNDFVNLYSEPIGTMCGGDVDSVTNESQRGVCERWYIDNVLIEHKRTNGIAINGLGSISQYEDGRIICRDWTISNITFRDVLGGVKITNSERINVSNITYTDSENRITIPATENEVARFNRSVVVAIDYSKDITVRDVSSYVALTYGVRLVHLENCLFENFYICDCIGKDVNNNIMGSTLQYIDKCSFKNFIVNPIINSFRFNLANITNSYFDVSLSLGALYGLAFSNSTNSTVANNVFVQHKVLDKPLVYFQKVGSKTEVDTNKYVIANNDVTIKTDDGLSNINSHYTPSVWEVNMSSLSVLNASLENESLYLLNDGYEMDVRVKTSNNGIKGKKFKFMSTGNIIPINDEEVEVQLTSVYTIVYTFKQINNKWVEQKRTLEYADGHIVDISNGLTPSNIDFAIEMEVN